MFCSKILAEIFIFNWGDRLDFSFVLAGLLGSWLVSWFAGWLVGWFAGWLVGWFVG